MAFWDKSAKKWSMEKESKKESKKRTQAGRFAAEAGASGGEGGFVSELCKNLHYHLARPATSDEVRRIYRLPPLPPTSQQPMNRIIDDSMTR